MAARRAASTWLVRRSMEQPSLSLGSQPPLRVSLSPPSLSVGLSPGKSRRAERGGWAAWDAGAVRVVGAASVGSGALRLSALLGSVLCVWS